MDCLSRMSILWGHADTEAYADFYMAYKNGFVMACDYFAPTVCWKYNLFIHFSADRLHGWGGLLISVEDVP